MSLDAINVKARELDEYFKRISSEPDLADMFESNQIKDAG